MSDTNAGWQPDPTGKHEHRYWDGSAWTENVADAGVAGIDPYEAAAPDLGATADAPAPDEPTLVADVPTEPEPPAPVDPTVVDQAAAAPDTTAAWSTTPGAPAPPPPYVATDPVASGDGGSKRALLIGGGILAAVIVAVLAFVALSGDDDPDVRGQLASRIREESDGDLSRGQADCIADLIVDETGEDAFEDVDFDAEDPPDVMTDATQSIGLATFVDECNIDEEALGGTDGATDGGTTDEATDGTDGEVEDGSYGSDPALDALYDGCEDGVFADCDQLYLDSPGGSEYEAFGDTCGERNEPSGYCVDLYEDDGGDTGGTTDGTALPDDFEETLADTYESMLDLDRDQAECLAGKLIDAIEDGSLNEEEAMSEFVDYLSDCDISMEEIGGN